MKTLLISLLFFVGCSGLTVKPPSNVGLSNSDIQKGAVSAIIEKGAFAIEPGAIIINNYFIFNTSVTVDIPNTKIQFMPKENNTYMDDIWKNIGFRSK